MSTCSNKRGKQPSRLALHLAVQWMLASKPCMWACSSWGLSQQLVAMLLQQLLAVVRLGTMITSSAAPAAPLCLALCQSHLTGSLTFSADPHHSAPRMQVATIMCDAIRGAQLVA